MIPLKSLFEIQKIEVACRIAAEVLVRIRELVVEGVTTKDLDRQIAELIRKRGAYAAFLGYRGFPASACISVNEEVVHGIPGPKKLYAGDIVGIDVGVAKDGFFGDAAVTYPVGEIDSEKQRLMVVTQKSLEAGIAEACEHNRISDISHAIESLVAAEGFSPVRALVGHGVGKAVHEEPQIPNFGKPGRGAKIENGMTLAIEPMINAGSFEVFTETDGWTVVTEDGRPSAHFEHTIAIVNGRARILTLAG